jgi:hypothetical protein
MTAPCDAAPEDGAVPAEGELYTEEVPWSSGHGHAPWPPHPADQALIDGMPAHLKAQRVIDYDAARWPFRAALHAIVCPEHPLGALETLHLGAEAGTRYVGPGVKPPKHAGRSCFAKRWQNRETDAATTEAGAAFRALLGRFVEEVVTPLLADADGAGGGGDTVYQRLPTFRYHAPGERSTGTRHRDYGYKRQPTEVNVWLPVTGPIAGSNGLYCESVPGKGDFAPFECRVGQAVLFWGNQCEHFSTPNATDTTRVSIDFRVVREDLYTEDYVAPYGDGIARFRRGYGYTDLAEERTWRRVGGQKHPVRGKPSAAAVAAKVDGEAAVSEAAEGEEVKAPPASEGAEEET